MCSKYWGLLTKDEDGTLSYETYAHLMKNINIVLLPHFKNKEMDSEIKEEWCLDSQGTNKLSYL